jgi:hydroxymethylbilane synthase
MVKSRLEAAYPDADFPLKIIKTTGDQIQEVALSKVGDKGLFTRQIEQDLLDGNIDLAVHSLKDLQTQQPEGLTIGAILRRELPNDVFVTRKYKLIDELPQGAKVATGSLRRRSQLLNFRPDLQIVEIRGNVPTRLSRLSSDGLDGMILAYAGMHRLGFDDQISQIIPFETMLPAAGQGAIAVESRCGDNRFGEIIKALDHGETRACVTAERSFLRMLEGGCQVPIGANARSVDGDLVLDAFVGSLDGSACVREWKQGRPDDAAAIGHELASRMLGSGAGDILNLARAEAEASNARVV